MTALDALLAAHPWAVVLTLLGLTAALSWYGSTLDLGDDDPPDDNYPWFS